MRNILILFLLLISVQAFAQETVVRGRVTDMATNEAIPFASVRFKHSTSGTSTDFDGYYTMKVSGPIDSVVVSYLGYLNKTKAVKPGITQVLDFQLQSSTVGIQEVVVLAGENPALRIIRQAIRNRDRHDKSSLDAYQYENYTKIQIDVDNISDNLRRKKLLRPVTALFDSLDALAGEDGKANLPMFYSENISDVYYIRRPFERKREDIKASKVTAVGIQDGILTSQFTGASFEQYNFNQNKLLVFNKEFLSPIADVAMLFYEYYLLDSVYVGDYRCYKIKVKPRNNKDLLFTGNIWITDSAFALKQVNLEIPKTVNINFLEKVQVQQELEPTSAGAWMPVKTRVVVDFADVSKKSVGMIAKMYYSCRNIVVNQPREHKFYEQKLVLAKDALVKDSEYWNENRHEKLSATDISVYNMIDTIRNMPRVRTYVDIFYTLVTGYKTVGKFDFGPYITLYSYNNIEGHKVRLGGRTNVKFSDKWILRGYLAYGTRDERFKYNAQVERILSRDNWTKVGIQRRQDIDQIGVQFDFDDSPAFDNEQSSLYMTTSQISRFSLLNQKTENRMWIESEVRKGFTQRLTLQNIAYKHFFTNVADTVPGQGSFQEDFTTSEVVFESRIAPNEYLVMTDNQRLSLGTVKAPIITIRYTLGLRNVLNSNMNYSKLDISINQKLKMGFLGYSRYIFNAGKVLTTGPYTLMEIHRGNQTPFFAYATFNMMNYFEFISDEYVSLDYVHHFQGLFFNRIPLIRALKWRELVTMRAVYGTLSDKNSSPVIRNTFSTLTNKPYVEAGFGVSNILKFVRVDFIYRLTYTDQEYRAYYKQLQLNNGTVKPYDVSRFGIKLSLQFSF
jgi:hypothetical protein